MRVPKKNPGVGPWVVGLMILSLLVWGLVELFGPRAPVEMEEDEGAAPVASMEILTTRPAGH